MKKAVVFTLFLLGSLLTMGLQYQNQLDFRKASYYKSDMLGNIFGIQNDLLWKYDTTTQQKYIYSVKSNGMISDIDVHDPLKIMVLYGDIGLIEVLDDRLGLQGSIDLLDLGLNNPALITRSFNNQTWVFDSIRNTLIKLDQNGGLLFESDNLQQLVNWEKPPQFMEETKDYLYLSNGDYIFQFDIFGAFIKRIKSIAHQQLVVNGPYITYLQQDLVIREDLQNYQQDTLQIKPYEQVPYLLHSKGVYEIHPQQVKLHQFRKDLQD